MSNLNYVVWTTQYGAPYMRIVKYSDAIRPECEILTAFDADKCFAEIPQKQGMFYACNIRAHEWGNQIVSADTGYSRVVRHNELGPASIAYDRDLMGLYWRRFYLYGKLIPGAQSLTKVPAGQEEIWKALGYQIVHGFAVGTEE